MISPAALLSSLIISLPSENFRRMVQFINHLSNSEIRLDATISHILDCIRFIWFCPSRLQYAILPYFFPHLQVFLCFRLPSRIRWLHIRNWIEHFVSACFLFRLKLLILTVHSFHLFYLCPHNMLLFLHYTPLLLGFAALCSVSKALFPTSTSSVTHYLLWYIHFSLLRTIVKNQSLWLLRNSCKPSEHRFGRNESVKYPQACERVGHCTFGLGP